MSKIPRSAQTDISNAANAFLHPGGGGIAIFVRLDELEPRAAIRLHGGKCDLVGAVAMAAALRMALKIVEEQLREQFARNTPDGVFGGMIDCIEKDVLEPRVVKLTDKRS